MVVVIVSANEAHANHQTRGVCDINANSHGRGRMLYGRGMVENTPFLVLELLSNYVANMGMMWWIVGTNLIKALHLHLLNQKL